MSRFFKPEELACKCGRKECDAPKPSDTLFAMLDSVRDYIGQPIRINSGCRCKYWNEKQGGVKGSEHETGEGADINCEYSTARYKIVHAALSVGCSRIGIGKDFVHLGVSKTHDQKVIWHYYGGMPR